MTQSQLVEEVDNIVSGIIPKKPIYKLKLDNGWGGPSIQFKSITKVETSFDSFIAKDVLGFVGTRVDFVEGITQINISDAVMDSVRSSMTGELLLFIKRNSLSKNPRLTAFYKWYAKVNNRYNRCQHTLSVNEDIEFENLLFGTWKHLSTDVGKKSSDNVIAVLEFIKAKFEAKLKGAL